MLGLVQNCIKYVVLLNFNCLVYFDKYIITFKYHIPTFQNHFTTKQLRRCFFLHLRLNFIKILKRAAVLLPTNAFPKIVLGNLLSYFDKGFFNGFLSLNTRYIHCYIMSRLQLKCKRLTCGNQRTKCLTSFCKLQPHS